MAGVSFGAQAVMGSGNTESGFSSPVGPSYGESAVSLSAHPVTWVAVGSAIWLAILYIHWRAY